MVILDSWTLFDVGAEWTSAVAELKRGEVRKGMLVGGEVVVWELSSLSWSGM